ncbi:MAG TPA: TetR-like C-terminal domain-containing protein, partial [Kineosporiaceae bacterium]|nr:TetR-like C-terminal domain-containing protein [Kineosporiaceae bacterium]
MTTETVVDAALEIIDSEGLAALTLAAVAARTGVAAPSLYKHIGGLADLRLLVAARVIAEMTDRFTAAAIGRSQDDAVAALMREYRGYVVAHPARYAAMPVDPLHHPALAATGTRLLNLLLAVLGGYGLSDDNAIHAVRRLRAVAHGFASIEAEGGFGLQIDLDVTYDQVIQMVVASLPRRADSPDRP